MAKTKGDGKKRYYAKLAKCSFFLDIKDGNGKPVPMIDDRGRIKYGTNGKPINRQRSVLFNQTLSTNVKIGCCVCHATDDPREIEALEAMAADPGTAVMTEKAYKMSQNREKFIAEEKLEQVQTEFDAVSEENKALKAKLEALEKVQAAQKLSPATFKPGSYVPAGKP